MFEKRTAIVEHNIKALIYNPDSIFSADSSGKLTPISRSNYLGRLINWLFDPKGLKVQTAVTKMLQVMTEKFEKNIKQEEDFGVRKISSPLKAAIFFTFREEKTLQWLKPYRPEQAKRSQIQEFDTRGEYTATYYDVAFNYAELAVIIARVPLFTNNPDILAEASMLRNKAIGKDIPVTAL